MPVTRPVMQSGAGSAADPHHSTGPIIVATDGQSDADGAVVAARLLRARTGAAIRVVSVVEPLALAMSDAAFAAQAAELYDAHRDAQRAAVTAQVARLAANHTDWPIAFTLGEAASTLAGIAQDRGAQLLVLGRGRHGAVSRLVMGETVTRLLQLASVPVLAVEPSLTALPGQVVIATDFSRYSQYAARVALSLVDPQAVIHLVYVAPRREQPAPTAALERTRAELGARAAHAKLVTLYGHAGDALVEFAARLKADLVVSGTHGYGFFNRLILGSVATHLVRNAPCSVLAVPGAALGPTKPGRDVAA